MESESSATGLFGVLRLLRQFRKATKAAERPTIPAELARQRYEPLIESLADALAGEFGVEWRLQEVRQSFGTYETRRWFTDCSLTRFPGWTMRLDAAVRRVVDVVDLPAPAFDRGPTPPMPPELERRLATAASAHASSGPGAVDDQEFATAFSIVRQVRDRAGADVLVVIEDDRTTLSAIASVRG